MKRILVVGATSGIATACMRRWVRDGGARLFLIARDEEKLEQTAADLRVRGAEVHACVIDATDLGGHAGMIEAAIAALGQIDIALIAHGMLPDQSACERDADLALQSLAVNGTSVIALLTHLANVLEAQRSGCLAVITSVAADRGRPSNYVYGCAKAAVSTFCEGLRARLFRCGVHVIDVRPGYVATPMTQDLLLPRRLVAHPDAIARCILTGIERRTDVLYTPAFWGLIMLVVRSIPRFAFNRMRL